MLTLNPKTNLCLNNVIRKKVQKTRIYKNWLPKSETETHPKAGQVRQKKKNTKKAAQIQQLWYPDPLSHPDFTPARTPPKPLLLLKFVGEMKKEFKFTMGICVRFHKT